MTLLELELSQWVLGLLGGGTLGVIIVAVINAVRFRKKDTALVGRTDAETIKIQAEAAEIKAKAEVTVADAALKLAQRLSDECDITRKQLEKSQVDLARITSELETLKDELEEERRKNEIKDSLVNELRDEIRKLKNK